jgi:glycerol-3-phosphate acyltransferase PlsY
MLYYNLIISILTESYSMIAVCCMIGLNKLNAGSFGDFIQSASTIFGLLILIVYPVLVFWVLKKNWKENLNQTKEKYQPIFENIRTEIGLIALLDPMYFLFRRLLMAMIVVFLKNLSLQVLLKDFSIIAAVFIAAYIHHDNKA